MVVLSSPPYLIALHLQKMSAARERNMSQVNKSRNYYPEKTKRKLLTMLGNMIFLSQDDRLHRKIQDFYLSEKLTRKKTVPT